MAFRSSEYVQRNELVRYQLDDVLRLPANNQHQQKNGYKFTIYDRSSFYDWYNAYFEVQFQVQKLANGQGYVEANRISPINGSHSLIKHLMIKSAGKIIYDTDNLHNVTFIKNLLEYSDDYSRSVASKSFWYLDVNRTTAANNLGFEARQLLTFSAADVAAQGGKNINVLIPLNRWSFFEELEDKMLTPMELQLNIELNNDDELIHKAAALGAGRVVINRFILWVPRITPRDSMYNKFVESFLKEKQWKYQKEMYNVSAPTTTSGFFQISSSIDNVKHIFVYLKNSYRDDDGFRQSENSPYTMDTFSLPGGSTLSNCRLEYGNGVFYPETEYDSESKVRIFNDVMAYAMRKNDYNTGTQLNTSNYNLLYPLIYFDLTFQSEKITRDPKQLIFRYRLSANTDQNFAVHAVVLYDEILKIDKIGNNLVIV